MGAAEVQFSNQSISRVFIRIYYENYVVLKFKWEKKLSGDQIW